jgi:threonine dehydratase
MKNSYKQMDIKKEALEAEKRIRAYIRETPVEYSPFFSQEGNGEVFLKLENIQISGSFKLRGTMNKLLSLTKKEKEIELITASSGNHAAAFAYALKKLGLKGTVYLPEIVAQTKLESLRHYSAGLKLHGDDCIKAELFARETAEKNNLIYIPPYNDIKIIAGQATIGIELQRQIKKIDTVIVPVGGGGLISGIAGYLKSCNKNIEIIGCQPENSPVMYESIKAGRIIEMESKPSLADGAAGGIEQGTITLELCKKYVDDFIMVTEEEIKEAVKLVLKNHYMLIEGAAALSVASFIKQKEKFNNKSVVLIISGAKIGLDQLRKILC